jgi:hypothetical protein
METLHEQFIRLKTGGRLRELPVLFREELTKEISHQELIGEIFRQKLTGNMIMQPIGGIAVM